jgi:hypothetical protein
MEKLFQYSLFAIFEQRKTLAVREVENLERSILRGPTLELWRRGVSRNETCLMALVAIITSKSRG